MQQPEIKYQVFKDGLWKFIDFELLKNGDTFRIIVGGQIYVDEGGRSSAVAKSNPYTVNVDGVKRWRIDT